MQSVVGQFPINQLIHSVSQRKPSVATLQSSTPVAPTLTLPQDKSTQYRNFPDPEEQLASKNDVVTLPLSTTATGKHVLTLPSSAFDKIGIDSSKSAAGVSYLVTVSENQIILTPKDDDLETKSVQTQTPQTVVELTYDD